MTFITAKPAYGRSYKNKAEVKRDWEANKDFRGCGFHNYYLNKQDFEGAIAGMEKIQGVTIRYGNNLEKIYHISNR
jgi:hypothetical protein